MEVNFSEFFSEDGPGLGLENLPDQGGDEGEEPGWDGLDGDGREGGGRDGDGNGIDEDSCSGDGGNLD